MGLERNTMALMANCSRDGTKRPNPYTPQDFYILSSDTQPGVERTNEDTFKLIKERFSKYVRHGR